MRVRLAIPKNFNLGVETREPGENLYSEKEIKVPIYEILKALKVNINEFTEGNDILIKINELKSNSFNRIEEITCKRVQTGIEYLIILDIGEPKIKYSLYLDMYDLKVGYKATEGRIGAMKIEFLKRYGILLNEVELKEIESYLYKHS